MIISASRRTDIPAFYADWFIRRICEGFVRVKNPFNPAQIRTLSLLPEDVEAIVFWTKNPEKMIPHLAKLRDYHYYFLFTLTAYGAVLEKNVPAEDHLLKAFRRLSGAVGPERVIWRYDPIMITNRMTADFHLERFERLAGSLQTHTALCVVSFVNLYEKCKKNLNPFQIFPPDEYQKADLASRMASIAGRYGIRLQSCAEITDLTASGIRHGPCIDPQLIRAISGKPVGAAKDPNQRKECLCARSVDIGAYNTCPHGCLFCYANANPASAEKYIARFDSGIDML